ncbi:MAG: alpha/beta hydrolase [Solirubrobacterales bacterium]
MSRLRSQLRAPVAGLAVALLACALAVPARGADPVKVERNVAYGGGTVTRPGPGTARLLMDLYRPATSSRSRRPFVVVIHGGGFIKGSKGDDGVVRTARALAARGIVAASIDYRLEGQGPVPSARSRSLAEAMKGASLGPAYPDADAVASATEDEITAVTYLKGRATALGLHSSRFGLVGSSAGAVIADNVAYVAGNYGLRAPTPRFVASLWGGLIVPAPGSRPAADNSRRGDPALFLVHGDADETVPVRLSDAMDARARAQRVPVEYYRTAGAGHGWPGSRIFRDRTPGGRTVFDRMIDFAAGRLR